MAQVPDWEAHVRTLVDDASEGLGPTVAVALAIDRTETWDADQGDRLETSLASLQAKDPGEGTDLVVGLVGALSIVSSTFDQLGMSETPGKHLVLRAPNVAREFEEADRELSRVDEETRTKIRRARLRHREMAVFLHELGHALGALHESSPGSLMRPLYDRKMSGYGAGALALMKARVAHLAPNGEASDAKELARARLECLRRGDPAWNDADRTQAMAHEEALVAQPSAKAAATPAVPPAPAEPPPPTGLRADDVEAWKQASALASSGDPVGAWTAAAKLFTAYPEVYEVQDLRCKLAMAQSVSYDAVRAECDPLMKLTMKPGTRAPKR
jgi:hypothetical protein